MNNCNFRLIDEATIVDKYGAITVKSNSHKLIGEVVFQTLNMFGEVVTESDPEYNDILISGSTLMIEKMFGKRALLTLPNLSEALNVNAAVVPNATNLKEEKLLGFMVGVGGGTSAIGDIKSVVYTDKAVPTYIPFRSTTVPLSGADALPYLMKKDVNGKSNYYIKKFTNEPDIKHLFTDGSEVPSNISDTGTTKGMRIFGEMICDLSISDIREYFMAVDGSLVNCRINTIGLITGIISDNEIALAKTVSTLNFRDRYLDNNEDTLRVVYRLYSA